jgi:endonuclease YncB( thermonuclease family)
MRRIIVALLIATFTVAVNAREFVEVTADALNVRATPSAKAPIVDRLREGDQLIVTRVSDNWAAILDDGAITGYLSTRYVNAIGRPTEPEEKPILLILGLLLSVFLVIAFGFRSRKKTVVRKEPPTLTIDEKTTHDGGKDTGAKTPHVQRQFDNRYQTSTQENVVGTNGAHDFRTAKVDYVIDGDTVVVSSTWKKTKIRLDSIDCPEDGQPWGDIATAGLIKMIGGRKVQIEEHGEDHYGRVLATIYVQNGRESGLINVNEKMVAKGHAWVMRRYYNHLPQHRKDKLNRIEKWARMKKVGLWKTPQPIPPWRWRGTRNNKAYCGQD